VRMVGPHDNHSILLCDAADEVPPTPPALTHIALFPALRTARACVRVCVRACVCVRAW
jgi:hypothetical protein